MQLLVKVHGNIGIGMKLKSSSRQFRATDIAGFGC